MGTNTREVYTEVQPVGCLDTKSTLVLLQNKASERV